MSDSTPRHRLSVPPEKLSGAQGSNDPELTCGPYAIATYALVCFIVILAFAAFVAGYATALHGLSPG